MENIVCVQIVLALYARTRLHQNVHSGPLYAVQYHFEGGAIFPVVFCYVSNKESWAHATS